MKQSDENTVQNLPPLRPPQPGEKQAAGWQVLLTTFAVITIIAVFFWGVTNQRREGSDEQTAATQSAPATPQPSNPREKRAPAQVQNQRQTPGATTGQGGTEERDVGRADKKFDSANPKQPAQPTGNKGQPAQAEGQ